MTIRDEIESLDDLTTPELAARYEELHGRSPHCRNRRWLTRRIAFALQKNAYGGLSSLAKKRLQTMMAAIDPTLLDASQDAKREPQTLAPGTTLTKVWHGERHVVKVLAEGFEWEERRFRSLSAVAKAITGAHWNGKTFFGVKKAKGVVKRSKTKIRVAAYARQSVTKGADQDLTSCQAQLQSIASYVQARRSDGWTLVDEEFADEGFTGGNTRRPGFQRLMERVEAGQVQVIAVYRIDRISRSLIDFTDFMRRCEKYGVSFVSVSQAFDTSTSTGSLMMNLLASFAQFEREQIGERIRDKVQAIRKLGRWGCGMPPHGYQLVNRDLLIDEDEARQVREAFQLYLAYGCVSEVVLEFDRRAWRTRKGKRWSRTATHRMLTTRTYLGEVKCGDEWIEGQHDAIVDREMFERVQTVLARNRVTGGGDVRNRWNVLLRDLLFCGRCGAKMVHTYSTSRVKRHHYYRCLSKHRLDADGCPGSTVRAHDIEAFVLAKIRAIGKDPELVRETLAALRREAQVRLPELQAERRKIASEGEELTRKQQRLVEAIEEGNGSASVRQRLHATEERQHELDARKAEIEAQVLALQNDLDREDQIRDVLERFDPVWDALDTRERIQVLKLLVERIEYHEGEGTVRIVFHGSEATYSVAFSGKKRPEPKAKSQKRVSTVARMLALAHVIERWIEEGTVASYTDAAKRLGISDRRVRHVVDLALLPTPVQSSILTGEIEVSDRQAERATKPLVWEEQEAAFGVELHELVKAVEETR